MSTSPVLLQRTFGPLSRTDLVRYAGASGDFNPVHHDEVFATSAGYPSVLAPGLLTAGMAALAVAEAAGGQSRLRKYHVRYAGQVWPGDTLTCTVTRNDDGSTADGMERLALVVSAQAEGSEPRTVLTGGAEVAR